VVLLLALTVPLAARSGRFDVTKAEDTADGSCDAQDCSLREAVLAANASAGSTVEVPAGVYRLSIPRLPRGDNAPGDGTNGNLVVGVPMTVHGAGSAATIIDARPSAEGAGIDRVFSVALTGNLTLSDVTVSGGATAGQGGGILVLGGSLALHDAEVAGNVATGGGGGIAISNGAHGTITRCEIAQNTSGPLGSGGGIQNIQAELTIADSTVRDNTAIRSTGGGIMNIDSQNRPNPAALLTVTGTTVTGNLAGDPARVSLNEGVGGGIYNRSGRLLLRNSTIAENEAVPSFAEGFGPIAGTGRGGGLAHEMLLGDDPDDGTIVISSTVAYNVAFTGSQLYGFTTFGPALFANTLVAGGPGATPNCADDDANADGLTSIGGGNLSTDASPCNFDLATDLPNVADPGLAPALADNGGPTQTIALLDGSPAIDHGFPGSCPMKDQRGVPRGSPCDIGAVEAPEPGAAALEGTAIAALASLAARPLRAASRRASGP
jgi:CSLREA domain-containing protein